MTPHSITGGQTDRHTQTDRDSYFADTWGIALPPPELGFVAVTSVDGMQDFVICCAISSSVQPQSKIASANPSQGMKRMDWPRQFT